MSLIFYKKLNAAVTSIPLFLHIFGLTMIYKTSRPSVGKRYLTTTFYFLISLSILEIIHLIIMIVTIILPWDSKWWYYANSYQCTINFAQAYFIMIYMTSERFFRIHLGIKYPLYWNTALTKRLIVGTFMVLIVISIPFILFYPKKIGYVWFVYIVPIFGTFFLIHFITCYSYIFWKVKKLRLTLNNGAATVPNNAVVSLNYKVPFLILLSACLLFFAPNIYVITLLIKTPDQFKEQYFKFLYFFHQVNLSVDALIYIWLTPHIKKEVVALFSCCSRKQSGIEIKNRQSTTTSSTV